MKNNLSQLQNPVYLWYDAIGYEVLQFPHLAKLFGITVLAAAIGFTALCAGACQSGPPPEVPPPPAALEPDPPPPDILQKYHASYTWHHNDLILDRSQRYTAQSGDTLISIAKHFY